MENITRKMDTYDDKLVWAELKPRIWAGVMAVLAVTALALCASAIAGLGTAYAIGSAVALAGAAVSWFEKERSEKRLEMLYSHVGTDIPSEVESKNWAKNLGLSQEPNQQILDSEQKNVSDAMVPPSQHEHQKVADDAPKLDAAQFAAVPEARTDNKLWSEIHPSKAGQPLVNKPQENYIDAVKEAMPAAGVAASR